MMTHRHRIILTFGLTALLCSPLYLLSLATGPDPGHTGGPFPGEQTCAIAGCHEGTPNSGPGHVALLVNGEPIGEYRYTPGETVQVTVRVSDPDQPARGFQMTARLESDPCANAGSLASAEGPSVWIRTNASVPGGCTGGLEFAQHSMPKGGGQETFLVNWTAPAENAGPVIFAAAGNAANGDGQPTGDRIYTVQATVHPSEDPGPEPGEPRISEGGVVLSTLAPSVERGSLNAILTVFGEDFAPQGTSVLEAELDGEGRVATTLGGTCVEVNGTRAPLFAVLPGQINFQAPADVALGPASIEVIRDCGGANEQRSDPAPLTFESVSPGFFLFLDDPEQRQAIATHDLDFNIVGPTGLPFETRRALPGEFVILYGTGFGATDPAFGTGEIPLDAPQGPIGSLTAPITVEIGGVTLPEGDIAYAGVSPCCAGLYQLVVKVPETLPEGNHTVIATVNGVASAEGPVIAVRAALPPGGGSATGEEDYD